jgi:hypothetical protein
MPMRIDRHPTHRRIRATGGTLLRVRSLALLVAGLLVLVLAGCGSASKSAKSASGSTSSRSLASLSCPTAWRAGWQKLANRIGAPVYCPNWMPNPLDAKIGGTYIDIDSVSPDRSYLVSFLYHEVGAGDVHVNFRGYPGKTAIPTCTTVETVNGVTTRGHIPCFADSQGTHRIGGRMVTVYTVNQDADQWHVLYAWRANRSLYTVSEHVIPPFTYRDVVRNLDRLMSSLAVVQPAG